MPKALRAACFMLQFFRLVCHQNDSWLQGKRESNSGSRPGTRIEPGCVFRWAQEWVHLVDESFAVPSLDLASVKSGWSFEKGDKKAISERAHFLIEWVRPPASVSRSIQDQAQALVPVHS